MKTTPVLATITLTLTLALTATATTARAATIAWGTAQNISADSNVLNDGLTVGALRLGFTGLTPATVNGVTFLGLGVPDNTTTVTSGIFTLNLNVSLSSNTGFGTTAGAYGQLPAATQNLLQSGSFSQNDRITLTINGLVIGTTYTFEYWANNAGNFTGYGYQRDRAYSGTTATGTFGQAIANTGTPLGNSPLGGVGQFDIGTFTADATSQSVFFTTGGQDAVELNAFQLRTVPEPSTYALALLGGAGLLGAVARQRRVARLRV